MAPVMPEIAPKVWSGIGVELAANLAPSEILTNSGLDWQVEAKPLNYSVADVPVIIDSHKALVKVDDGKLLSVITKNWKPVQNHVAFERFKRMADSAEAVIEVAGSMHGDRLVWALARHERVIRLSEDDVVHNYLFFTNPHIYGEKPSVRYMPIRSPSQGSGSFDLGKEVNAIFGRAKIEDDFSPLGKSFQEAISFYETSAGRLSRTIAQPEDINKYLSTLFPNESVKDKSELSKPAKTIKVLMKTAPGCELFTGTWWHVYNTVLYAIDHVLGQSHETRMRSSWYGFNLERKISALDIALAYTTLTK